MNSVDTVGVSQQMSEACKKLPQVRAPVKVLYGGPGELWRLAGNRLEIFEQKTQTIRTYLKELGMDVESGAEDFRSQFVAADLDDLGHFLGRCCGERPRAWLKTLLLRFSFKLWMHRNAIGDVAQVSFACAGAKHKKVGCDPPAPLATLNVQIPRSFH